MASCATRLVLLALFIAGLASGRSASQTQPKSVTVPVAIDHNRIVIDAEIPMPDGSRQHVRVWVDNGNPDLEMSQRVAALLGLSVVCDGQTCSGSAKPGLAALPIQIGGLQVLLHATDKISVSATSAIFPGMSAEINLPSTVLRNYDLLVDFPGHQLTIGLPGTIHFQGQSVKVKIDSTTGLIQVPNKIENKKYDLELDLGANISFLSEQLFEKLATEHTDWPRLVGAIGSANMWGMNDEPKWKLMRLDRLQYGPLFLTNLAVVESPNETMQDFGRRAGMAAVGSLASQALLNYRVGIDYAHSLVYFDIGRMFNFPDFDVVGLILRPENDGQFSILGVVDFNGKPSVATGPDGVQPGDHLAAVDGISVRGSTMGQVWSLLGGTPGQERKLTVERAGRKFSVAAGVVHFLGESADEDVPRKKR
jgi:hypothetical protein